MTTVHTLGHSTRTIDELIALLRRDGITRLVDIRTVPRSRHNPQFEQEALSQSLSDAGIEYVYLKSLGGLRSSHKDSINTGWRNQSFRNYADHMQTDEFAAGIDELVRLADEQPTAIMCAEAVPWRCHRSLVGDALLARGVRVLDVIGDAEPTPHQLTSFAVVDGQQVTYPGEDRSDAE